MIPKTGVEDFLRLSKLIPIIDVRSPGEFEKAHIPGAYNIPLFDNYEREQIGTKYKQNGKEEAVMAGLEIVGPKMKDLAFKAKEIANDKNILVHCWRGGMRSASMAWLFQTVGLKPIILKDGYKEYRRYSKEILSKNSRIIILSGSTGSGKTDILKELQKKGEQVVDLEGIAHHKGSAFGAIGEERQLDNEQFENNLFENYKQLDFDKTIWIEDESRSIGKNYIPTEFYDNMRKAPVIKINIGKKIRIKRLVKEYTNVDKDILIYNINRIKKRLGGLNTKLSIEAVENNDYATAIDYTLEFYDKAYKHGLYKRENPEIYELDLFEDNPENSAKLILEYKRKIQ